MDGLNRSIVVSLFLVVLAIAGVSGYVFLQSQQAKLTKLNAELASLQQRASANPSIHKPLGQFEKSRPSLVSLENRQRTASLQRLLKKKDVLLNQQLALLKKSSGEKEALRKEIQSHLALIVRLAEKQDGGDEVSKEVERLRTELGEADEADTERATEVETLQTRLADTEKELDELRGEAEARLAVAEAETEILRIAASSVIVAAAESAVPALTKLLGDERPAVRIWAANELEAIGSDAADAIDSLTDMMDDENRAVQDAARSALRAIVR